MARIPERWDGPNQWYFVTVVTQYRQPVFDKAAACECLKQAFHAVHPYIVFGLPRL